VSNAGDVIIGTTNPQGPLTVFRNNNSFQTMGAFTNNNNLSGAASKINIGNNSGGNLEIGVLGSTNNGFVTYGNQNDAFIRSSAALGNLNLISASGNINLNAGTSAVATNADLTILQNGNVGIGIMPARTLHVNAVMRLEPIPFAPTSPGKGDIYFDSTLNKLRVFDGISWQNCW
jgi:hypothetical protein